MREDGDMAPNNMTRTQEIRYTITDDARKMVDGRNGGITDAQKTVAMNAIRALEHDPQNVSALLPMLIEKYLEPSAAVLISGHQKDCLTGRQILEAKQATEARQLPFGKFTGGVSLGGVIGGAIIWLIQYITNRGGVQ